MASDKRDKGSKGKDELATPTSKLKNKKETYDASTIAVLEGREAVRKRPAMYIGSTGELGLHHLVYEVVDNSIDEALAGYCDAIEVSIHLDNSITVYRQRPRYSRGYDEEERKSAAEVVMTKLHAGGKFDSNAYKVSGGLHGVGVSCVNFLAEELHLEIWRDGLTYEQDYERGIPVANLKQTARRANAAPRSLSSPISRYSIRLNSASISCRTSARESISQQRHSHHDQRRREEPEKSHEFYYRGGIAEFVKHLNKNKTVLHDKPIYFEKSRRRAFDRSRDSSTTTLRREGLFVREQHQHRRWRHAPLRISLSVHAYHQRLAPVFGSGEEFQRLAHGRRCARRPGRGHLRKASATTVRGSDERQAQLGRQRRGRIFSQR
jgi:hypothetical protein